MTITIWPYVFTVTTETELIQFCYWWATVEAWRGLVRCA